MDVAKANTNVFQEHVPQVLFLDFGDSTLNFELRVWVIDANTRMPTRSELHQDIDRRFREANIEIAFPQRDLHLRSIDPSVQLKSKEPTK
jgi:small-conductance mechanosensitive channel